MEPSRSLSPSELSSLLLHLASGTLSELEYQQLLSALRSSPWHIQGSGGRSETTQACLELQVQHFQMLYPKLQQFCQTQLGWDCPILTLWEFWLPLAEQLSQWHQRLNRPFIQGILGGQGTGKTTLTLILSEILNHLGLSVCRLSIDDLYKTYAERQTLQQFDSRFRWRGPPGTHDVELGLTVLQQLRQGQVSQGQVSQAESPPVALPRFDKSAHGGAGDRAQPEWVTRAEVILFEGWFVGVRPVDPQIFDTAPPPITTDADRDFAREVNARLQDYLPLWDLLDHLIVLYPTDYRLSQQWRGQAEQQMIESGQAGMSQAEISQFVEYFWQALHPELFIQPLLQSDRVDWVIEINAEHRPAAIYCPGSRLGR